MYNLQQMQQTDTVLIFHILISETQSYMWIVVDWFWILNQYWYYFLSVKKIPITHTQLGEQTFWQGSLKEIVWKYS